MDQRFAIHNLHHEGIEQFLENDPDLRRLARLGSQFESPLIQNFPVDTPGIYILSGGRQVGKTTLLKQWMKRLLVTQVVTPNQIAFISGDIIDDYHQLLRICQSYLEPDTRILIVDEVTYIREWDRAIKFLADTGALERISVMLSGSDSGVLSEARSRFPGRRGMSDRQDFELLPLSFRQCVALKLPQLTEYSDDVLEEQWEEYLLHGGYLTAINQYVDAQKIPVATLATYSDWIRGDFLKRNKNENTLMEVVTSLLQRLGSQITWNALAKSLSIEHPATLASYVEMLSTMSVVVVQSALDQNKLRAAPKKAKKIHVVDPFIYHALYNWIRPSNAPFEEQMTKAISDQLVASLLAESVAVSHANRRSKAYYIKADGEVGIALIQDKSFTPIEVKWTSSMRKKDLKQISKYPNGQIWSKSRAPKIGELVNTFLPRALYEFEMYTRRQSSCPVR